MSATQHAKIATVVIPGTKGNQLAQGKLISTFPCEKDGKEVTYGRLDVEGKVIEGELV
ncbi:hypothetical protein [Salipiger sp. PrR003]|uniref:hypothetical protein n=1 Tax=Salipiger sp. PrR003 TaxID=2706776 RepID=UPI0013DCE665|nr:hypothetical protein [Salipiger sp. PrR003]NDV52733.1 hypothetical protein [Salipiger sp. PrR003]